MLASDIVEPHKSPWPSPIAMVKKKIDLQDFASPTVLKIKGGKLILNRSQKIEIMFSKPKFLLRIICSLTGLKFIPVGTNEKK